jgi:hypothetical protein
MKADCVIQLLQLVGTRAILGTCCAASRTVSCPRLLVTSGVLVWVVVGYGRAALKGSVQQAMVANMRMQYYSCACCERTALNRLVTECCLQ